MPKLNNYYCYNKDGKPFMVVHAERLEKITDDYFGEEKIYYAFFIGKKVILTCASDELSILAKE